MGRSLSCFCCDVLVGGDESFIFDAFGDLVESLQLAGRLSSVQVEEATNEFKSFVVEVRSTSNLPSVGDVQDSLSFVLSFASVFSKSSLLTVSVLDCFLWSYMLLCFLFLFLFCIIFFVNRLSALLG